MITRSAARHLRRKRLNEARRARNQFEFINGVDEKIGQETINREAQIDSEKNKLTKSKARRLRKKEKAKLLETSNCDTSLVSSNIILHFEPNWYEFRSYLTPFLKPDSEDQSESSRTVVDLALPESINKEQTHCTENSPGNKRSYLESSNIKVDQLSETFPVSDEPTKPIYFLTSNAEKDQAESKDISLNDKTLEKEESEDIVTSEICPLKYGMNI